MVRHILLILICSIFTHSKAQTYYPFPDSNAVWNFSYSMVCLGFPGGNTYADYSITITGDTTINNVQYKKLFIPAIDLNISGSCLEPSGGYKGAIRQDTSARKVYIVPPASVTEVLLYDFTLQVGDTLKGYLAHPFFNPDTVQVIDSVLIGNSYRKRWIFNYCYSFTLIEGIGSTYGLIESSPGCIVDCCPSINLTCFKENNQVLYPDTATSCDIITVSMDEKVNIDQGVTIYPNPVSDELNILIKLEKPGDVELQIYNKLGHKINFLLGENVNMGENNIKLSVEDIPYGVYILKLLINEKIITKKIIKH